MVANRVARSDRLNRAMASKGVIGTAKRLVPGALHPVVRGVARAIFNANRRRAPRTPLDPGLRDRLRAEFRLEVELLSELVGRDLAADWWDRSPTVG